MTLLKATTFKLHFNTFKLGEKWNLGTGQFYSTSLGMQPPLCMLIWFLALKGDGASSAPSSGMKQGCHTKVPRLCRIRIPSSLSTLEACYTCWRSVSSSATVHQNSMACFATSSSSSLIALCVRLKISCFKLASLSLHAWAILYNRSFGRWLKLWTPNL